MTIKTRFFGHIFLIYKRIKAIQDNLYVHIVMNIHTYKTKLQNFLDPRFSKKLVLVKPRFLRYRPLFDKQFIITQIRG